MLLHLCERAGDKIWRAAGFSMLGSCPSLPQITKTFKGETVLHDVTWEVKKGEKVGLIGVNGAGKTTQLQVT